MVGRSVADDRRSGGGKSLIASKAKLGTDIATIFDATWSTRDGYVVPDTDDVALKNGAVKIDAVTLYADLAHSTELARTFPRSVAAKIVRAYLSSMAQLVKAAGGEVKASTGTASWASSSVTVRTVQRLAAR